MDWFAKLFRGKEGQTHDYTSRCWGHDYGLTTSDKGMHLSMHGWGFGIHAGDYLLLQNKGGSTRYKVDEIEYTDNVPDMWFAKSTFAPRKSKTGLPQPSPQS